MAVLPLQSGGATGATRFGDYRLLRKIASGGTSEVWLATTSDAPATSDELAVKRLLPSVAADPTFIATLRREARALAALDPAHPNTPRFVEAGVVEERDFLAMEYVHGRDLRGVFAGMRERGVAELPLEHAITIAASVASALGAVHGNALRMVHRDVSPGNIVVSFAGDVKLVDFGFALADDRPGKIEGTAGYTSPEQVRGEPLDGRSDVFALGVLLFELTTGKRLYRGDSEYETAIMIRDRDAPLPSTIRPDYPPELEAIVIRALARVEADRYESARALLADLRAFAGERDATTPSRGLARFMASLFPEHR